MPHWIVDARSVPGGVARLLDEVVRWRDETGDDVLVVVDGSPTARVPEGRHDGVDVRYGAADEIVRVAAERPAPAGTTVATSDPVLRARIAALGAAGEDAQRFRDRLAGAGARRRDRAILATFGVDESALLGRGGEARVFALDADRVLRLPHPGVAPGALEERRRLLASIATPGWRVALPEVLEHREVEGRLVVVERRLPGRTALEMLAEPGRDREALVRDHLDVARRVPELPCPTDRFGEILGGNRIEADGFAAWAEQRLVVSLRTGGEAFAGIDPQAVTRDLVDALPEPEPARPRLVHLDVFLGNMLAVGDRISALLDFGPMTIGGPRDLDALVAVAYLAPEITPTAGQGERRAALAWAEEAGLAAAVAPAERWIAAYWTGAPDDERLRGWCRRVLGCGA
jgi:aminoglycoside phosphotransferase (APT) family kinase protein